jgi:hypothetical protein
MKLTITLILTLVSLLACGDGSHTQTAPVAVIKTYPCDSSIVAVMSTMGEPSLLGLGVPDTTTYTSTGQNHTLAYDFTLARTRIEFEYNSNYCRETVTQH